MNTHKTISNLRETFRNDRPLYEIAIMQLSGKENKKLRQQILYTLTGELLSPADSNINRVKAVIECEQMQLFQ